MDEYTLSEVCYMNGFANGQNAPIYYATGSMELVRTMSHNLEAVEGEIETLSNSIGWLLTIYEATPNTWDEPRLVSEFEWNDIEHKYVKRNLNLKK